LPRAGTPLYCSLSLELSQLDIFEVIRVCQYKREKLTQFALILAVVALAAIAGVSPLALQLSKAFNELRRSPFIGMWEEPGSQLPRIPFPGTWP
jgi:hypothetical protein